MRLRLALHKGLHWSVPKIDVYVCICRRLPAVPGKRSKRLPGVSLSMDLTV